MPTRRTLVNAVLATLLAVAASYWLLSRPAALEWAVTRLTDATGTALEVRNVSGSLVGVIRADRIHWRARSGEAVLEQVELIWSPLALLGGTVAFERVRARTAHLLLHGDGGHATPAAVRAGPVKLRFDAFAVDKIIVLHPAEPRFLEIADRPPDRAPDASIAL